MGNDSYISFFGICSEIMYHADLLTSGIRAFSWSIQVWNLLISHNLYGFSITFLTINYNKKSRWKNLTNFVVFVAKFQTWLNQKGLIVKKTKQYVRFLPLQFSTKMAEILTVMKKKPYKLSGFFSKVSNLDQIKTDYLLVLNSSHIYSNLWTAPTPIPYQIIIHQNFRRKLIKNI